MGQSLLSEIEKPSKSPAKLETIIINTIYDGKENIMSSKKTTKATKVTRKATFRKVGEFYTPVNKRAKTVAKKAGKRTRVTKADLKALKNTGTYKYYQYVGEGFSTLKAIRV